MQLLIYSGPEPRKPLVAVAEVGWEGATLGLGTIDFKSDTVNVELVYECVGAAFEHHFRNSNAKPDIRVNETTFCRLVEQIKSR